jgi:two-component system response regulator DesR
MTTVVVIEGNAGRRDMLRGLLELECELTVVGHAANGVTGLALIERVRPRVAIVDIDVDMPGIDGISLIRQLRAQFTPTRFVAYAASGYGFRAAMSAGADAVVSKSDSVSELLRVVLRYSAGGLREAARSGAQN